MRKEDRRRAIKHNEEEDARRRAQDVMTMNDIGARSVDSGPNADLLRGLINDTHAQVKLGGQQYELPTPEEAQAKKIGTAQALLKLTGRTLKLPKELADIYGSDEATVPQEQGLQAATSLYNILNPNLQWREETDAEGNLNIFGINPRKGVVKRETYKGAGKPSGSRSGRLAAGEIQQQARDAVLQSMNGGNQFIENPDIAKAVKERVASGKSRNEQEAKWFITQGGNPNTLKLLYPHLFKNGKLIDKIDVTDLPEFKEAYRRELLKRTAENRAGSSTAKSGVASGSTPKSVPASKVAAAAKKNGISVNEMRKRLAARGVEIDEEN
jgi:hypothetical protein